MTIDARATSFAVTSTMETDTQNRSFRIVLDLLAVFVISAIVFLALFAYLDNTNINTTNGLWKSLRVKEWVENSPGKYIDNANVLLFPVNGLIVRYMPEWVGPVYRRMAMLNCFYGALGVAALYALLRGLSISRIASACGAIFQAGCAFFLICAISSEDIMPAVAFLMAACAVVAWTWDRPSYVGVFLAAQPFSLAWLFEWRLLVPSLPAFLLALSLAPWTITQRIKRSGVFLASALVLPAICATTIRLRGGEHPVLPSCEISYLSAKAWERDVQVGPGIRWGSCTSASRSTFFRGEFTAPEGYFGRHRSQSSLPSRP